MSKIENFMPFNPTDMPKFPMPDYKAMNEMAAQVINLKINQMSAYTYRMTQTSAQMLQQLYAEHTALVQKAAEQDKEMLSQFDKAFRKEEVKDDEAKPAEKKADKPDVKAAAKPATKKTAKAAAKSADKPTAKKTAAKPAAKPAKKAAAKPAKKAAAKPATKSSAKPAAKPAAKKAEKPVAKPAEKPAEQPAES